MTDSLSFNTTDVFTQTAFAGNPLAIVHGADGLTTAQMQTMAREFNLSETIFVQRPQNADHTAKVRIFFPNAEIPFAGHPTIGCAIHLATARNGQGDFDDDILLEEEAGLVPVRVWRRDGLTRAEFTAPVLPHATTGTAPAELAAAALDLPLNAVGFGDHRPAVWQGGPSFTFVPVVDLAALASARPIEPHWSAFCQATECQSAYLYSPLSGGGYRARMFDPAGGIPEDPATGSASAILSAQLLASDALQAGENKIALEQGVEMGRPSEIGLTAVVSNGALSEIRISGTAVPISSGHIRIPS